MEIEGIDELIQHVHIKREQVLGKRADEQQLAGN